MNIQPIPGMATVEMARMALDAASLRQQVIADNIANVNTTDHVHMEVKFEEELAAALDRVSDDERGSLSVSDVADVEPRVMPSSTQGKLELDAELTAMSSNGVRYQALSKALSRYLSIAGLIANGGRG